MRPVARKELLKPIMDENDRRAASEALAQQELSL